MLSLLIILAGCSKGPDISGSWVGRFKSDRLSDRDVNRYQAWTLQLNKDGTFTEHHEFRIMMDIFEDGKGTYSVSGDTLTMKGNATIKTDDGYVKETHTDSFTNELKVSGRCLIYQVPKPEDRHSLATFATAGSVTFWRTGEVPLPARPPQDPKAEAILKKTEAVYAAMKSYRDKGVYRLENTPSWKVTFKTRFLRDKGFLFDASIVEDKKVVERHIAWINGSQARWSSTVFNPSEKGPIEPILDGVNHEVGIEALLLSHLLMPQAFHRTLDQAYPGARLEESRKVEGHPCWVLMLINPDQEMQLALWIDKASGLIRQAATDENNTYVYKPEANPKLVQADLAGHALALKKAVPHHRAPQGQAADP